MGGPLVVFVPGAIAPWRPPARGGAGGGAAEWLEANRTYYDFAGRTYFPERPAWVGEAGVAPGAVCAAYDFRTVLGGGYLGWLREFLRGEGGPPVVVVGHGVGAVLARAALAGEGCRRVRALVEVCPAHGGSLAALEAMQEGGGLVPAAEAARAGAGARRGLASAARSVAGLTLALPNRRAFGGSPVWTDWEGSEVRAGEWPWPEVDDAWRHLALPVLEGASRGLPASVGHVLLHSAAEETPVGVDRPAGEVRCEPGDGVVAGGSSLCGACDHTDVRRVSSGHLVAARDRETLRAVQKFLW